MNNSATQCQGRKFVNRLLVLFIVVSLSMASTELLADNAVCNEQKEAVIAIGSFYKGLSLDDLDSGLQAPDYQVSYCEYIQADSEETLIVDYIKPEGEKIAQKRISLSENASVPLSEQLDYRSGELRALELIGDELWVRYRKSNSEVEKSKALSKNRLDVNDAGFNDHILKNWKALETGEILSFSFLSKAHLRTVKMTAEKIELPKLGDQYAVFKIDAKSVFFRLLSDSITVVYDKSTRKLAAYDGVVNIRDESGKTQSGLILYREAESKHSLADVLVPLR